MLGCSSTSVRLVKTLIDPCPHFVRQATLFSHLLELHQNTRLFKKGERYIRYKSDKQHWCVYAHAISPQIRGRYTTVMRAVFYALK